MKHCQDLRGVLPILDLYLPGKPTASNLPWYCTELATPMLDVLRQNSSLESALEACMAVAETLAELHARGVSHRDIKPDNLFYLCDRWVIGDFGLASFPEKADITPCGEKLGPLFYIAPEMLNGPHEAEGSAADVYSLGKLLWKLLTGQRYPSPGPHDATASVSAIKTYVSDVRTSALDTLIEGATRLDTKQRISAQVFASELRAALEGPAEVPNDFSGTDISRLSSIFDQLSNKEWREIAARREKKNANELAKVRSFLSEFMPVINSLCDQINEQSLEIKAKVTMQGGGPTHIHQFFDVSREKDHWVEQLVFEAGLRPSLHLRHFKFVGGLCFFRPYRKDEYGIEDLAGTDVGAAFFISDTNIDHPDGLVPIWSLARKVTLGGPSEGHIVADLSNQLMQNFGPSVAKFLSYVVAEEGLEPPTRGL